MNRTLFTLTLIATLAGCTAPKDNPPLPETCAEGYDCMVECLADDYFATDASYTETLSACLASCEPLDDDAAFRLWNVAVVAESWCTSDHDVEDFDSAEGRACLETAWSPSDDPNDLEGWPREAVLSCVEYNPA